MSLSDSKEVGSHNDPIDLCESSDDSESRQSTRSTAAARMSISDLKRLLNERGIDHSDCVEKGDLVERLLDDDSRAVCNEQESMGNFTIKELKFQLDKRGVDYSDCIEKSDLVRRLEMSAGMKRVVQSSTHPCERRKKAAAKRPRTSKQSVIDSHIKLSRTDLDFEKCARSPVVRDHTMTLRQMLGLDASVPKYYTDCSIDWIIISNFMIDFDYVLGVVPELYSVPTCVVFYGQADTVPALQTWKQATDVEYVYLNPSEPPKSPGNPLKYKFPFGVHHTKMFLVGRSNGTLRVIIHTANLLQGDCQLKTQAAYIQDFPFKEVHDHSKRVTEFENDLVDYIETYGYNARKHWNGRHTEASTLSQVLRKYDFSSAKAVLIASAPGYHPVSLDDRNEKPLRGYLKLSKAIHDHCPANLASSQPIVCQFSSLGYISAKWLKKFATALNAAQQPCENLESSVKLVFPTAEEIRNSTEGYVGGGSVPSNAKNVDKDFLQPLYHKWSSATQPLLLHKPRNVPHIKTFYQLAEDSRSMQWFCVTSHNLSTPSWGQIQNSKWGGRSFYIQHWELGVFVAPSMFGENVKMVPIPEACVGRTLVESSDTTAQVVGIPLPYPLKPTKYGKNDTVFSWEKTYSVIDAFGRRSTRG